MSVKDFTQVFSEDFKSRAKRFREEYDVAADEQAVYEKKLKQDTQHFIYYYK